MTQDRQGSDEHEDERNTLQRRLLLVPFCIAVFSLSALLYYHLRQDVIAVQSPLQVTYAALYRTFGFAPSLMFFLLLLIWTSIWFFTGKVERPFGRLLRLLATTVMLGVFLNVGVTGAAAVAPQQGELGAFFAIRMVAAFGYYPTLILVLVATLGALLLATDFLFSETFERLWARSTGDESEAAAADVGVESAVTDHLKGLAASVPPTVRPVQKAAGELAGGPSSPREADTDEGLLAEAHEFAELEAEVEPPLEDPLPEIDTAAASRRQRVSYFERRYQDTQHAGGGAAAGDGPEPSDEDWEPAAPEAQEFDNPEFAAANAALSPEEMLVLGVDEVGAGEHGQAPHQQYDEDESATDREAERDEANAGADYLEDQGLEEEDADVAEDEGIEADLDAEQAEYVDSTGDVAGEEDLDEDQDRHDIDAEGEAGGEPLFAIPRPEPQPEPDPDPASHDASSGRQQKLFGQGVDEDLIDEARQVVIEARRASASFLRRRLRIGYDEACEVLVELSARGVVELGDDAGQARVIEQ